MKFGRSIIQLAQSPMHEDAIFTEISKHLVWWIRDFYITSGNSHWHFNHVINCSSQSVNTTKTTISSSMPVKIQQADLTFFQNTLETQPKFSSKSSKSSFFLNDYGMHALSKVSTKYSALAIYAVRRTLAVATIICLPNLHIKGARQSLGSSAASKLLIRNYLRWKVHELYKVLLLWIL